MVGNHMHIRGGKGARRTLDSLNTPAKRIRTILIYGKAMCSLSNVLAPSRIRTSRKTGCPGGR